MAFTKSTSFAMLFAATAAAALLLSSLPGTAEAKHKNLAGINPFCRPSTNMRLCNKMVKNATTLRDASTNAINSAIYVATKIQTLVPLISQSISDLPKNTRDDLIKVCADSFQDTIEDLHQGLDCFNKGDMGGADTHISAAFRSDCADSLKDEGASVFLLTKLSAQFNKVVDNTLAVVFQRYADDYGI